MASFKSTIITQKGHNLMAKLSAGTATMSFTKIKSSDHDYSALTSSQLEALVSIDNIKQEVLVNEVTRINDASVKVSGSILNTSLTTGYYIKTIALYANDPDEGEILYSITVANESDWMPPYNNVSSASILIDLITVVSNAENVTIDVDPNAIVTITQFNEFKDNINASLSEKANNTDVVLNNNTKDIYLASFFDNSVDRRSYLYTSMDGKDFTRISDTPVGLVNRGDTGIIYKNNKFYLLADYNNTSDKCNFTISTSTNLYDWVETKIKLSDYSDDNFRVYGSDWFLDDNGKIYIVYSRQEGYMPNGVSLNFRPRIVEVTDLENLQFGTPQVLNISNYNRIDPTMIKNNGIYYLFVKKELDEDTLINGTISIWTSTDMTNWTKQTDAISSLVGYKFEGPSICNVNGTWFLYIDNWDGSLNGYMHYCTSSDLINWSTPVHIQSSTPLRHGSVFKIDNILGKKIINNLFTQKLIGGGIEPLFTYNKYVNGINITANLANKYIELFDITMPNQYTAFNIKFKLSDTQNMFNNSEFILCGSSLSSIDILNNCTFKEVNSYKTSIASNLVVVSQGGVHKVFLKIGSIVGCTPTLSIIDFEASQSIALIIKNSNAVSALPSGTQITASPNTDISNAISTLTGKLRLSKTYQTLATTNTTVSFYGVNGIVKIQGHANGYTEGQMIDYNLMLLNGNIGLVKLDVNGATITVALNSYSNGVYNITITTPAQYSIFDLTLPVGSYFN